MDRGWTLRRAGDRRTARGAAAVEFALVSSVLALILFGVLQYGFYFNDSLKSNESLRSSVRNAVVEQSTTASCTGTFSLAVVKCATVAAVARTGAVVKVVAPNGWAKGSPLVICTQFRSSGGFGFLPMPNGGYVHTRLQMSIEQTTVVPTLTSVFDPAPSGQDWSWC